MFLNKVWLLFCKKEYKRFIQNSGAVEQTQVEILMTYLHNNAETTYGKKNHFHSLKSYQDYALNVPIINDWQQLHEELTLLENGHDNVLTQESVFAFEQTSGSTGFSKLIPYTKQLRKEFSKALDVWMYSLKINQPGAFNGKSFWSISPALKQKSKTKSGIPIGLESDLSYLDPFSAMLMKSVLVDTSQMAELKDKDLFYFTCLKQLVAEANLSFVSVWSPHYFLVLDDFLRSHFDELISSLESSNRRLFLSSLNSASFTWKMIWPNLNVLSCWDSAQSAVWIPLLKEKLGDVFIQGKGLMSTEAATSFPFGSSHQQILAYRSHFFEFRNLENNQLYLAHELELGKRYESILTTGSGLYRYASKDIVEVIGFEQQVPYLKFIGRLGAISDKVGEKLHESHFVELLKAIWAMETNNFKSVFFYPEMKQTQICYVMAIELVHDADDLVNKIEMSQNYLCQNPYYQQAIASGQLQSLKLKLLKKGAGERLLNFLQNEQKIKLGDIKLPLLLTKDTLIQFINAEHDC